MFKKILQNKNFHESYFNFWTKLFNYKRFIKLYDVDFNKPWWHIIWKQKWLATSVFTLQTVVYLSNNITLFVVGFAINQNNFWILAYFIVFRIVLWILNFFSFYLNAPLQMQSVQSVAFCANKFLLEVDPIYHSTKSSGKIIAKVSRGSRAYETILDIISFEILNLVSGVVIAVLTLLSYDRFIGLVAFLIIILVLSLNVTSEYYNALISEKKVIEIEDTVSQSQVENLQQAGFIRSTFNTENQLKKLKQENYDLIITTSTRWHISTFFQTIINIIYVLGLLLIGGLIFTKMSEGLLSQAIAISLISTYIYGSSHILYIGALARRFPRNLAYINDLFSFIRGFGKQTYPVLEGEGGVENRIKL